MVQLIIKTDKDIHTMLNLAFQLAASEDKYNKFYRTHPGFEGWVNGSNPYTLDADMVNLRMMEILDYMDCDCWTEGGTPSEWDDEPDDLDWRLFMEA